MCIAPRMLTDVSIHLLWKHKHYVLLTIKKWLTCAIQGLMLHTYRFVICLDFTRCSIAKSYFKLSSDTLRNLPNIFPKLDKCLIKILLRLYLQILSSNRFLNKHVFVTLKIGHFANELRLDKKSWLTVVRLWNEGVFRSF